MCLCSPSTITAPLFPPAVTPQLALSAFRFSLLQADNIATCSIHLPFPLGRETIATSHRSFAADFCRQLHVRCERRRCGRRDRQRPRRGARRRAAPHTERRRLRRHPQVLALYVAYCVAAHRHGTRSSLEEEAKDDAALLWDDDTFHERQTHRWLLTRVIIDLLLAIGRRYVVFACQRRGAVTAAVTGSRPFFALARALSKSRVAASQSALAALTRPLRLAASGCSSF